MIHEAKVYANRVNRVLNNNEKLQREPKEELLDELKKLFESRKKLKEKIQEKMENSRAFEFDLEEQDLEKGVTKKLINEIYSEIGENVNYENFINSVSYTMGEFMQIENGEGKKELYHEILDKELFLEINKLSKDTPIVLLYKEVEKHFLEQIDIFTTWKEKIFLSLENSKKEKKSSNANGMEEPDKLAKMMKKMMRIEVQRKKFLGKLERLSFNLKDLGSLDRLNSRFIKPNIDISAGIKMYAKKDKDKLLKLLFNLETEKQNMISLKDSDIEEMLVEKILKNSKLEILRSYKNCLEGLPSLVYAKHLKEGDERVFTRLDYFSGEQRKFFKRTVKSLENLKDLREGEYEKNWFEEIVYKLNLGSNYLKFVLDSKLQNFTISVTSFDVLSKSFRGQDALLMRDFSQIITESSEKKIEKFYKQIGNQKEIVKIVDECLEKISEFEVNDIIKLRPNSEKNNFGNNLDGKSLLLDSWISCFDDESNLYDFNERVDYFFVQVYKTQQNYLEFCDYWNNESIFCIKEKSLRIKFFDDSSKKKQNFFETDIKNCSKMKLKSSVWLQEKLVLVKPSRSSSEHLQEAVLRDQRIHPAVQDWIQLVQTSTKNLFEEKLDKKISSMLREKNIRNLKGSRDVKDFIRNFFGSYYKMLALRSRSSMAKLLGYCNMYRFLQKDMNLSFKSRMEGKDHSKDFLEIRRDNEEVRGVDFTFNVIETDPNNDFFNITNPVIPSNIDSNFTDFDLKEKKHGGEREKKVFRDKIYFENLSNLFKENDPKSRTIFYPIIKDIFGSKIMYDSSISDYFTVLDEVSKILSFFIENELISVETDKFNIFETEDMTNFNQTEVCDKNFDIKISQLDRQFNYEYLVTKILEYECIFQGKKAKLLKILHEISSEFCNSDKVAKIFDFMSELMKRRPDFDLNIISSENQNIIDQLRLHKRKMNFKNKLEISNTISTIFDSYDLEIKYLENVHDLLQNITKFQIKTENSLNKIQKSHEVYVKKSKLNSDGFKPLNSLEHIIDILVQIEAQTENTINNFYKNTTLDEKTFTHFIFDFHFKSVFEKDLELENKHKTDFLVFLNSFMNNTCSRVANTEKILLKLVTITEATMAWKMLMVGKLFGDEMRGFKSVLENTSSTLTNRLDEYALICNDKSYFSDIFIPLQGAIADDMKLRKKFDNLNNYFVMLWHLTMENDIKLNLKSFAYFCSIWKYQKLNFQKRNSEVLTSKFQDIEDFLHGKVTIMKDLFDLEQYNMVNISKLKELLKRTMLDFKSTNNSNLRSLLFYNDFLILNKSILKLSIKYNSLEYSRSELVINRVLRRVLTNKDTVMNHIYQVKRLKESYYMKNHAAFSGDLDDKDYRYFLLHYKNTYLTIYKYYLRITRSKVFMNPLEVKNRILKNIDSKLYDKDDKEVYKPKVIGKSLMSGLSRNSSVGISFKTLKKKTRLEKDEFESKHVHTLVGVDAYEGQDKDEVEFRVYDRDQFCLDFNDFFRKEINFAALKLENSKVLFELSNLNNFFSFNPTSVVRTKIDPSFNISFIKTSILKALRYKNYEPEASEMGLPNINDTKLLEDSGILKSFLTIPLNENMNLAYKNDINNLYWNDDYKFSIKAFFRPIVIFKSQKKPKKFKKDLSFYQREKVYFENDDIIDNREIDIFAKSSYAYLEKMSYRLSESIGGLRDGVFSNTHDLGLIKTGADFRMNRRLFEPDTSSIKRKMEDEENKEMKLFSEKIEHLSPCNLSGCKMYAFCKQNASTLKIFRKIFQNISFEWDPKEIMELMKNSHPYFTLNNLRLRELENLLYSRNDDDEKIDVEGVKHTAEYKNLRTFLFIIKRKELKNRSTARNIFSTFQTITERLELIMDDPRVISPLTLFQGYLDIQEKMLKKKLPNALIDILNQINAIMVFGDMVETRTDELKKDKLLLNKSVRYLKMLLGVDENGFQVLNLLNRKESLYKNFEDLKNYSYLPNEVKAKFEKFREVWDEKSVNHSTSFKILQDFVKKSMFALPRKNFNFDQNFDPETYLGHVYSKEWYNELSLNLTLNQFQRAHISKKLNFINIQLNKESKVSKKVVNAENLWISRIFENNRILEINLKYNILNSFVRLVQKLTDSQYPQHLFKISLDNSPLNSNIFNSMDHLFYSNEKDRKISLKFYQTLFKSYVYEIVTNSSDKVIEPSEKFLDEKDKRKVIDFGVNEDFNITRFIEMDDYFSSETGTRTEKNRFLKRKFNLEKIWPEYLKKYIQENNFNDYLAGRIKKFTKKNPKSKKHLRLYIIGYLMSTFTETWFKSNKIQALSLLVNSIKTNFKNIIQEEGNENLLRIERIKNRSKFSKEKDLQLLKFSNYFVGEVVKKSYLLGMKHTKDQIAINCGDFRKFFIKAQNLIFEEIRELLQRTEQVMFHSTDEIFKKICLVQKQKNLMEFAMKYCEIRFNNVVYSKLLSRNLVFVFELDALKRYLKYLKFDNKSLMHKVDSDLTKKFLDELTTSTDMSYKMIGYFEEYKRDSSAKLSSDIEKLRNEKILAINMLNGQYKVDCEGWKGEKLNVKVDIEKKDKLKKKRHEMIDHQYLHKALLALRLNLENERFKRKNDGITKIINEREKLNHELTELKEREDETKMSLIESKKVIAQLEVENNLLRAEIHGSQFKRIKLLKKSNELKNNIEELEWEKERGEQPKTAMEKNFMEDLQIPDGQTLQRGYKKCLVAETTLNYSKEPVIRYMDLQKKLQSRVRISKEIKKNFGKYKLDSLASVKKNRMISEVDEVFKSMKEGSRYSASVNDMMN